ncbi:pilus assembly protein CpaE [Sphingomonas sp. SORGH_AS_0879]|uniref:AAA family ATPase n=1 Tax=Sphingomonas sp. SORGH_AS_0879 TaxID=3041790 RepID=UPI00277D557D|nr:pilus assembly protein CpaE [Sphingomonas sp. SORGH_AS_0879]MDQ1229939.1 pilus assembly protein CpaE [Sphingomonas sp. SORGH_AS_0879]
MNAPWTPHLMTQRDAIQAYVCDDWTAEAIRPIIVEHGWSPDKVLKGGLRGAIQALSVSASPQILLVDLSDTPDPTSEINNLAEVCEPGTIVIAVGQVNDVRLYRMLMASGLHDYLLKPINADMLRDAIGQARTILHAPRAMDTAPEKAPCNVAVVGVRGGVGTSTVATSLGWLMAERLDRTTAILDLDVHFGTAALALDLEPGRGLVDAIDNPGRIDGLFLERAMVKATPKLAILSAEAPISAPIVHDGLAFAQLQDEMRINFETTIVDLPRNLLIQQPILVTSAQTLVLVTELTLAAARDTIRILSWLKTHAPQTSVLTVANRVLPTGQSEIAQSDFEGSIERPLDFLVPYDPKLVVQAAKVGKPIAELGRTSRTIAPLVELSQRICASSEGPDPLASNRRGLLDRFDLKALLAKRTRAN